MGLLFAYWGINFVRANMTFNEAISAVPVGLDWNVLLFAFGVSLSCAVLCSLAPALRASRTDINTNLQDEKSRGLRWPVAWPPADRAGYRRDRVGPLFLLIGTGLLIRGIFLIEHQNLGFQADRLLTASVTLDSARYKDALQRKLFVSDILPRLQHIPGAPGGRGRSVRLYTGNRTERR